nr:MAG TPA: Protein of unknown function (DUF1642) [Caudoviricetes sp.]
MNKQELIEGIEAVPAHNTRTRPWIDKKIVLGLIRQLDEPEKVKVSEEEAKFLKTFDFNCKSDVTAALYNISRTGYGYHLTDNNGTELKGLSEEFRNIENRKRLIRAILFGYEVKKEKRYIIKVKGVPDGAKFLKYAKVTQEWYFGMKGFYSDGKIRHTRKQLEEANFGWVFDCPGIEIEEVE